MRTAGIRFAALLGVAFLMGCGSSVPDHANVRVQNNNASTVSLVLTNTAGGSVTISSVAPSTLSEYVDLPLGAWTASNAGSGISITGATFTAVGTDNYTLVVSAGAAAGVTVKRE
ncbi:MAG: hypothetical protein ABIZ70_03440 [Gemmatimonadales bacterium]